MSTVAEEHLHTHSVPRDEPMSATPAAHVSGGTNGALDNRNDRRTQTRREPIPRHPHTRRGIDA